MTDSNKAPYLMTGVTNTELSIGAFDGAVTSSISGLATKDELNGLKAQVLKQKRHDQELRRWKQRAHTAEAGIIAMYQLLHVTNLRETGRLQPIVDGAREILEKHGFKLKGESVCMNASPSESPSSPSS